MAPGHTKACYGDDQTQTVQFIQYPEPAVHDIDWHLALRGVLYNTCYTESSVVAYIYSKKEVCSHPLGSFKSKRITKDQTQATANSAKHPHENMTAIKI